jgi:predicted RNase H-like HicB family nuclease
MAKYVYPAIFSKEDDGKYSVLFPDIENCYTGGDDMADALEMAEDVLCLTLYGMEKDGDPLPPHTGNIPKLASGDIVAAVSVFPTLVKDEIENRRERTAVTIPHWLKTAAEAEGLNYSRLLEAAIKEKLGIAS